MHVVYNLRMFHILFRACIDRFLSIFFFAFWLTVCFTMWFSFCLYNSLVSFDLCADKTLPFCFLPTRDCNSITPVTYYRCITGFPKYLCQFAHMEHYRKLSIDQKYFPNLKLMDKNTVFNDHLRVCDKTSKFTQWKCMVYPWRVQCVVLHSANV